MAIIYGLKDPTDNQIKYVGCTTELIRRFHFHLRLHDRGDSPKIRWIKALKDNLLIPGLVVLEECDDKEKEEREVVR